MELIPHNRLMVDVNDVQRPLQELSGQVRYLDEVLSSSALQASATGNSQWHDRYDAHVAQVDAALHAAVQLAPGAEKPLAEVDQANTELVAMETLAFESVRQNRKDETWQLLNSEKYRTAKRQYGEALGYFIAHLDAHQQTLLTQARAETQVFVIVAAIAAIVILLLTIGGGYAALCLLR